LKNYILRIYQYKKNDPHRFVGVVDEPDKKEKRAFTNLDELWDILNPGQRKEPQKTNSELTKESGVLKSRRARRKGS